MAVTSEWLRSRLAKIVSNEGHISITFFFTLGNACKWYTWVLGHSRAGVKVKSCPVFINVWPLGSQDWNCYKVYYSRLNSYICSTQSENLRDLQIALRNLRILRTEANLQIVTQSADCVSSIDVRKSMCATPSSHLKRLTLAVTATDRSMQLS